ncbi:MAG: prolyl aminopeptidase [Thiotrichaceae bacterium]|nr:prolyl aminopeptidase [Thiotrichaceae bacterium]
MANLYPAILPYRTQMLKVDDRHTLYIEECGNPNGIPVVFLHGGPGAGCESYHRRFFNPEHYRIILFDQRGCGRSRPHAELRDNTTDFLIKDMEKIRVTLDIDRWVVFGGSWGSTLALIYSVRFPQKVSGIIVRGIYFCSKAEIQWFYQRGANRFFPDHWQHFLEPIPILEQNNLLHAYYQRLTGDDELAQIRCAKAWATWEARTATLLPKRSLIDHFTNPHTALSLACLEAHYFVNDGFMEDLEIIKEANAFAHISGFIIQGRYDVICPAENAYKLHDVWTNSELNIVETAGHAASETDIISALISATDTLVELVK